LEKMSNSRLEKTRMAVMSALLFLLGTNSVLGAEAPGNIRFQREGAEANGGSFPPAVFPHWIHRINYRCDACHNSLFRMEQGSTKITMAEITAGKSCGNCHNGQAAFDSSVAGCGRCHAQANE
jgi:c(7)-type cytochrome triheme protein